MSIEAGRAWQTAGGRGVLIMTAAPKEAEAIAHATRAAPPVREWVAAPIGQGVELVRTGVGKVNAALATATCVDPARHGLVLNLGICGRYGADAARHLLGVVVASASVYADEGLATDAGFTSIEAAGFAPGGTLASERAFEGMGVADAGVADEVAERLQGACERGAIMTVSTCSGTDDLARALEARHRDAIAEGMEGAAIGHAVARLFGGRVRFGEVRVVSNTTGDRSKQVWKLREAMSVLGAAARTLISPV